MSNGKSSQISSAPGLSQVRSVTDIPTALTEAELECSALRRELKMFGAKYPEHKQLFDLWAGRHGVLLDRLTKCRQVMLESA